MISLGRAEKSMLKFFLPFFRTKKKYIYPIFSPYFLLHFSASASILDVGHLCLMCFKIRKSTSECKMLTGEFMRNMFSAENKQICNLIFCFNKHKNQKNELSFFYLWKCIFISKYAGIITGIHDLFIFFLHKIFLEFLVVDPSLHKHSPFLVRFCEKKKWFTFLKILKYDWMQKFRSPVFFLNNLISLSTEFPSVPYVKPIWIKK